MQRVEEPALHDDADVRGRAGTAKTSLSSCARMYSTAAGQRSLIFCCSCAYVDGGRMIRSYVRCGFASASRAVKVGPPVVVGDESAMHVAGADAHHQHHRRVARLGQLEPLLDELDDGRQIGTRIEQPHLRLHRERVRALLHDAGAFAVVFAEHDQRATRHARRGEVRERIGCDVGADRRLPRDRAADRIVDRGRQHRGGGRFARARFERHAELAEDLARVGQHVHQVRDRRALVATDVTDTGLQQRLGDGENRLAFEHLTGAESQRADFLGK